jgi:Haemolymph juvenile hormone binding protein (JHBP)
MRIDRIRILQGEGPVSVNASLTKVKVQGFSKVKVTENQVSSKDYNWVTTIKLPKMRLEGNYHMQGRILVIPLNVSFAKSPIEAEHKMWKISSFRVAASAGLSRVSVHGDIKTVACC